MVAAQLLEERTRKGGWKARHEQTGLAGPIQNTGHVPADKNVGDTLELIVASANEREIAFRYPTPAEEQRTLSKTKGKRSGSGKGGRKK